MKFLFWFGLIAEGAATLRYLYKVWIIYSGQSGYIESYYPDLYSKNLVPAAVFGLLFFSALIARFYFQQPKIATYIVLVPVFVAVLAGVGMIVTSMFIRDWK